MKHYIAITCSALARSIYAVAATTPATISIRLLDQGLHNQPRNLREQLQAQIDAIEPDECDAILMAYGICGTSTLGLVARHTSLVIPRVHDCIALYLGSHQQYQEEFDAHPGTYWYSVDYMERSTSGSGLGAGFTGEIDGVYEEYVEKYGKENADYLMEVMGEWGQHYERAVFIDTGIVNGQQYEEMAQQQAERRGWLFERKEGNRRMLEMLLHGDWVDDEFLTVAPGHEIKQANDERLLYAEPAEA
jgi:hypothetical protein